MPKILWQFGNCYEVALDAEVMTITHRFRKLNSIKFSFVKDSDHARSFAHDCHAFSMYDDNFGLGIPSYLSPGNQLRAVFIQVMLQNGFFLFNINNVDLNKARKGFKSFEEAINNHQITEWELFMILRNKDYFKNCIFHNGKVQFKKRHLWNSIVS